MNISKEALQGYSVKYSIGIAEILAVAEVEGRGNGFLADGKPVILFEPHIFWRELSIRGKIPEDYVLPNMTVGKNGVVKFGKPMTNPKYRDLLYPEWRPGAYGKYSAQWEKLERAIAIDEESALYSASWGLFQIMGFNWALCGCLGINDFVEDVKKSEEDQLRLFLHLLISRNLLRHLRAHNWALFAEGYNGKSYKKNRYDWKLEKAYHRHKKVLL